MAGPAPVNKWKVLGSVVFGLFMVLLDATAINVAFATIQRQFAAGVGASQWVISLYTMALGISTPLAGYLGDRFGQKRVFTYALALFTLGSFLCGISPSLWTLIAARAIQGFGGGIALPLGTAMLYSAFPLHERGKAMGVFGVVMVAAPALGPILGGALVDAGHWRWIFFINIPIGLLGILLGNLWLGRNQEDPKARFDPLGLLFSAVGFGSVLYAASIASEHGWSSPTVLTAFAVGALALAIFAIVELRVAKEPLLDLRLFGKPVFTLAALTGYVSVVALFGAEFLMPLYLQILRGRTALEAGVLLLPMALSSAVVTPLSGRFFDRIGARALAVTGFGLLAINTYQLSQLTAETSISTVQWLLALRGVALGLTVQTTLLTSFSVVPMQQTARASSLVNATRQVIQSIGVAFLATILASSLSPEISAQARQFQQMAPAATKGAPRVEICQMAKAIPHAAGAPGGAAGRAPTGAGAPLPPQAVSTIRTFCDQYVSGFEHAYRVTFYASLLAVALGATLPGWPGRWSRRDQPDAHQPGH